MTKQYEKFLETIDEKLKHQFLRALKAVASDAYQSLDVKKLIGQDNLYRIRIGKWRIVFRKERGGNKILKIESRWDVYKWL